jgi:WD40 repeat protein
VVAKNLLLFLAGCERLPGDTEQEIPEQTIVDEETSTGTGSCGTSGTYAFVTSPKSPTFEAWRWSDKNATMERCLSVTCSDTIFSATLLFSNAWISDVYGHGKRKGVFCVGKTNSEKELYRFQGPPNLHIELGRGSSNGKYLAAWCMPDSNSQDRSDRTCFGFVAPDGKSFEWVASIVPEFHDGPWGKIRRVVSSNDGAFIGVAGWKNGVLMVDVNRKDILWIASWEYKVKKSCGKEAAWRQIPLDETNTTDLAFLSERKLVYTGGASGCVFGMKVKTGEIVSKWWATPTNKEMNGYRISTISVSPDGRFVAAGTGPTGDVYLFSTNDGERRIFRHGGSTILITSFSPDSKRLATFAAGQIKIWKLP